ncbi:MAG: panC [Caulobacteraceae bacterium]|nr:panC [Caulobacteraceae bacterium]
MTMPILRTVKDLRAQIAAWRATGETIGLVPTMGALHEGHLSLVTLAKVRASRAVATLFVNPTQFGPNEDLSRYPRDEAGDAAKLAGAGCDALFAPGVDEVYPPGFSTTICVSGVSEPLDGAARPGHFAGVATVVAKLLIAAAPDIAVFGEKDYQQLQVIKRLVIDLALPVEIIAGPTRRAEDGLALSSRNAYLSEAERTAAPALHRALQAIAQTVMNGGQIEAAEAAAIHTLKSAGFGLIDYVEVRQAETLARLGPGPSDEPARVLAAAFLGRTRLIDNIAV